MTTITILSRRHFRPCVCLRSRGKFGGKQYGLGDLGMMRVRAVLFIAAFYSLTAIWAILLLTTLPWPSHKPVANGIAWWSGFVFRLTRFMVGIEVEIRGLEKLPTEGSFILAGKHQSTLDAFAVFWSCPRLVTLGKKELFRVPILGSLLRKLGIIAIDRKAGDAHKGLPDAQELFIRDNRVLVLFPEGTRVAVGAEKPLKPGIFHYQKDADLPVYTMATNVGLFWPVCTTKLHPGKAVFEFHEAMPRRMEREAFMALLKERLIDRSEVLMQEAAAQS